jgi:Protein of unknown function (DUF2946)
MFRLNWLLIVVILLKLGMSAASPILVMHADSALPAILSDCHSLVMADKDLAQAEATTPPKDQTPEHGCDSESCHLCCALDASNPSILASQATPTAPPLSFNSPWNSVSPPAVLRPPIV